MIPSNVTGVDLTERLATIKGWAADAEPATDAAGAAALRCVGYLCDVVEQLTDRVLALETELHLTHRLATDAGEIAASFDERIAAIEYRALDTPEWGDRIEQAIRRHRDTEWHEAPR